jgi:hypothetical protein
MKKYLSYDQVCEIKKIINKNGFLKKEEVVFFREKFEFSYETFKRELIEKKIPFVCGNLSLTLSACNIQVIDKKIELCEFDRIKKWGYEVFKNSKIRVKFECKKCKKETDSRLEKIIKREFFPIEPICSGCINKVVRNTNECKKRNSEAQLIAQNKPEVKKRMSEILKERCSDVEYRKKMSVAAKEVWKREEYRDKMVNMFLERWENVEYAKKVIENRKKAGIVGFYKDYFYNSGYELAFLLKEEEEKGSLLHIKRVDFYISYKDRNGKRRSYYCDFIKDDNYLIEVKGYGPWVDLDKLERKNKAAREWCDNNCKKFRVIEYKDFGSFWYSQAKKKHKELKNGKTN